MVDGMNINIHLLCIYCIDKKLVTFRSKIRLLALVFQERMCYNVTQTE